MIGLNKPEHCMLYRKCLVHPSIHMSVINSVHAVVPWRSACLSQSAAMMWFHPIASYTFTAVTSSEDSVEDRYEPGCSQQVEGSRTWCEYAQVKCEALVSYATPIQIIGTSLHVNLAYPQLYVSTSALTAPCLLHRLLICVAKVWLWLLLSTQAIWPLKCGCSLRLPYLVIAFWGFHSYLCFDFVCADTAMASALCNGVLSLLDGINQGNWASES